MQTSFHPFSLPSSLSFSLPPSLFPSLPCFFYFFLSDGGPALDRTDQSVVDTAWLCVCSARVCVCKCTHSCIRLKSLKSFSTQPWFEKLLSHHINSQAEICECTNLNFILLNLMISGQNTRNQNSLSYYTLVFKKWRIYNLFQKQSSLKPNAKLQISLKNEC